jgi:hypothetical protein
MKKLGSGLILRQLLLPRKQHAKLQITKVVTMTVNQEGRG